MSNPADADALLLEFEKEHRAGRQPDLWRYLSLPGASASAEYLCGLIQIDLQGRLDRGERPWLDAYCDPRAWPHRRTLCRTLSRFLFSEAAAAATALGVRQIGPYLTTEILGFGGFGTVLRGHDPRSPHESVAIKIAHPAVKGAEMLLRNEVGMLERIASELKEANGLPRLVKRGTHAPFGLFSATAPIEGVPLSEWLQHRRSDIDRLRVCHRIASIVNLLHDKPICHGDLTPDNILVTVGSGVPSVHLIDFAGSSLGFAPHERLATLTLAYAAPELLSDAQPQQTVRSDVWSLAAVIYEVLSRVHAFGPVESTIARADWIARLYRPSFAPLHDRFGAPLRQMIANCLCPDPNGRDFGSARGILRSLPDEELVIGAPPRVNAGAEPGSDLAFEALQTEYLERVRARFGSLPVPLVDPAGGERRLPIDSLVIDLPLSVQREAEEYHESLRGRGQSHAQRAQRARQDTARKAPQSNQSLGPWLKDHRATVLVGQPGCGKSTLLAWTAYRYAAFALGGAGPGPARAGGSSPPEIPRDGAVPVVLICRDVSGTLPAADIGDLLAAQCRRWGFTSSQSVALGDHFTQAIASGRAVLLVDGLDEIADLEQRRDFCRLLENLAATTFCKILVTCRVIGFKAVQEVLRTFENLMVQPLPEAARAAYVRLWAAVHTGLDAPSLVYRVCKERRVATLCENMLMLALITQMSMIDGCVPDRRVDIFRRLVHIMLERQRSGPRAELSFNEVWPHLERLAYRMQDAGAQRRLDTEVIAEFTEVRKAEPDEPSLSGRDPAALLEDILHCLGLLNVVGREVDRRNGLERRSVQFFHQSLQEYFAGQALIHGRGPATGDPVKAVRALVFGDGSAPPELGDHAIGLGKNRIEPVIAERWQESIPMAVAELSDDLVDDAIEMLLPTAEIPLREARARVILALRCIAECPAVSEKTAIRAFDVIPRVLAREDGLNTRVNTMMDDALSALGATPWGSFLQNRLLHHFCEEHDAHQRECGLAFLRTLRQTETEILTPRTASSLLRRFLDDLQTNDARRRTATLLCLTNTLYGADEEDGGSDLSYLADNPLCTRLFTQLLRAVNAKENPVSAAALWALDWLVRARWAEPRGFPRLDDEQLNVILPLLTDPSRTDQVVQRAAIVASIRRGDRPVWTQQEWIYELAVIADGGKPQWALPRAQPINRLSAISALLSALQERSSVAAKKECARSLGRLGAFPIEASLPLIAIIQDDVLTEDERDEAMVYLMLGRTAAACEMFLAAGRIDAEQDSYLSSRGLFGLIGIGNVSLLRGELSRPGEGQFRNEYALALAGLQGDSGLQTLRELESHSDPAVRNAVRDALKRRETWKGSAKAVS